MTQFSKHLDTLSSAPVPFQSVLQKAEIWERGLSWEDARERLELWVWHPQLYGTKTPACVYLPAILSAPHCLRLLPTPH